MFARLGADVVEREAAGSGPRPSPVTLTRAADLDRLVTATVEESRRDRHPRVQRRRASTRRCGGRHAESVTAAVSCLLRQFVGLRLPHLRASGRGRIIAIESTSVRSRSRNLALSNAVRPASWAAETLSRELGPDGITVNTIAPGRIDTERLRALYGADGPPAEALALIPADGSARRPRSPQSRASSRRSRPPTSTAPSSPVDGGMLNGLF